MVVLLRLSDSNFAINCQSQSNMSPETSPTKQVAEEKTELGIIRNELLRLAQENAALTKRLKDAQTIAEKNSKISILEERLLSMELEKQKVEFELRLELKIEQQKGEFERRMEQQKEEFEQRMEREIGEVEAVKHTEVASLTKQTAALTARVADQKRISGVLNARRVFEYIENQLRNLVPKENAKDNRIFLIRAVLRDPAHSALRSLLHESLVETSTIQVNLETDIGNIIGEIYSGLCTQVHDFDRKAFVDVLPIGSLRHLTCTHKGVFRTLLEHFGFRHDYPVSLNRIRIRQKLMEDGVTKLSGVIGHEELRLAADGFELANFNSKRRTFCNLDVSEKKLVIHTITPHFIGSIFGYRAVKFLSFQRTAVEARREMVYHHTDFACELSTLPVEGEVYTAFIPLDTMMKGGFVFLRGSQKIGLKEGKKILPPHIQLNKSHKDSGYMESTASGLAKLSFRMEPTDILVYNSAIHNTMDENRGGQRAVLMHFSGTSVIYIHRPWGTSPKFTEEEKQLLEDKDGNSLFPETHVNEEKQHFLVVSLRRANTGLIPVLRDQKLAVKLKLHMDRAPSHKANNTVKCLKGRQIKSIPKDEWLPHFLDLSLLD